MILRCVLARENGAAVIKVLHFLSNFYNLEFRCVLVVFQ